MSPEACVAYLDQTLPFEFCWNALVSLKSNSKTIVFCVGFARFDSQTYNSVYCIGPSLSGIFQLCTFISFKILTCTRCAHPEREVTGQAIDTLCVRGCAKHLLRTIWHVRNKQQ